MYHFAVAWAVLLSARLSQIFLFIKNRKKILIIQNCFARRLPFYHFFQACCQQEPGERIFLDAFVLLYLPFLTFSTFPHLCPDYSTFFPIYSLIFPIYPCFLPTFFSGKQSPFSVGYTASMLFQPMTAEYGKSLMVNMGSYLRYL